MLRPPRQPSSRAGLGPEKLRPTRLRVKAAADIDLASGKACPAHNGEKSSCPRASAAPRSGLNAAPALGNAGGSSDRAPSSDIRRVTMPRAGRPVKRLVKAVTRSGDLKALR